MRSKPCLVFSTLLFLTITGFAQRVGINNNNPQATLDVSGDLVLRAANVTVTNGNNTELNLASNRFSYYRISGATAAFSISGISGGTEGRLLTLFNRSGFTMTLNNNSASAGAANRVLTGANGNLDIPDRGIVNLQYDGAEQRWVVLSNNKPGNGSGNTGSWELNGNSGTGINNFIGTTDNQPLLIKSNNETVAEFRNGGASANFISTTQQRTGIGLLGSTPPAHTLEVGPGDIAGGSEGAFAVRGSVHLSHINYGSSEHTYIRGGKNESHVFLNDLPGMGNVGIGTAFPPEYKLHLWTAGEQAVKIDGTNSLMLFHDGQSNAQYGFLRAWTNIPYNPAGYYGLEVGVPPVQGGDPPKRLMFSTNYALRMVIMENGNVGIGTVNPSTKLAVNGDIRSREVVVETANWPDYVFKKDYPLQNLSDLEAYIRRNGHLPNIPSAAEIENQGQKLGDIQKKLMEKIEELTLYILQQQKQINELRRISGLE